MDQFSNGFNIVGTLVKLNSVLRGLRAGQPYLLRSYLLKMFEKVMFGLPPSILSATTVLASDLELPGLPTTNKGILSSIHTTIINTFSLKASLQAMFGPSSSCPIKAS